MFAFVLVAAFLVLLVVQRVVEDFLKEKKIWLAFKLRNLPCRSRTDFEDGTFDRFSD